MDNKIVKIEKHLLEEASDKLQSHEYAAARSLIQEASTKHFCGRLAVFDVLCAAYMMSPRNGIDWYSVLQLPRWADAYAIEGQYKRFSSLLEPIKMGFYCAETALSLIGEAYAVLSDPTRRAIFDSQRNGAGDDFKELKFLPQCDNGNGDADPIAIEGGATVGSGILSPLMEGTLTIKKEKDVQEQQMHSAGNVVRVDSTRIGIHIASPTFSCNVGEKPPQEPKLDEVPVMRKENGVCTQEEEINSQRNNGEKNVNEVVCAATDVPIAGIHTIGLPSPSNVKRPSDELFAQESFVPLRKKFCTQKGELELHRIEEEEVEEVVCATTDIPTAGIHMIRLPSPSNIKRSSDELLAQVSFDPLSKKLGTQRSELVLHRIEEEEVARENPDVETTTVGIGTNASCEEMMTASKETNRILADTNPSDQGVQENNPRWSAEDFEAGQIWAVYCDTPDSMPRSYVRVTNVESSKKVSVTLLEPHPLIHEENQWLEENLPFACGVFRAGWSTATLDTARFSHPVEYEKNTKKPLYRVLPCKGEIWAMYTGWSSRWKLHDLNNCRYRIVQILSDFSDESGIHVCSLVEVDNWMTFFQRQYYEGSLLIKMVPRSEFLSFSYRIPAYTVLGIENHGFAKRTWHLSPDALPPRLARP